MNLAIIQARLNSTRLPEKAIIDIAGKPAIQRVVDRVRKSGVDDVAVAIAKGSEKIVDYIDCQYKIADFDGRDVLREFYECAEFFHGDTLIRITADCVCIDPKTISFVLKSHKPLRYTANRNDAVGGDIDGNDVEVFDFFPLLQARYHATEDYDREHVTPYIYMNYLTEYVQCSWNVEPVKLSLDTLEDYKRICTFYEKYGSDFTVRDLVKDENV